VATAIADISAKIVVPIGAIRLFSSGSLTPPSDHAAARSRP